MADEGAGQSWVQAPYTGTFPLSGLADWRGRCYPRGTVSAARPAPATHATTPYSLARQPLAAPTRRSQIALAAEADTNRRYTAYCIRALQEGYPEVAQSFFEAAGAETVHAYSHLVTLDAIGTTLENLRAATRRETSEIEQMYQPFRGVKLARKPLLYRGF